MPRRLKYEDVKKYIENVGYELISKDYKNSVSKIVVKCPRGHIYEVTFDNFKKKNRKSRGCPNCKKIEKSKTNINRVSYEEVKTYIESFNYKLLTERYMYKGVNEDIVIQCPNNHIFNIKFSNFKKREVNGSKTINKCVYCNNEEKIARAIYRANELGYKLNTKKYSGKMMKLDITCCNGHSWTPTYDSFVYCKNKCVMCYESKGENKVESVLEKYNIEYSKWHRFKKCVLKRRLPFDFYLPKLNTAIEYDGEFHYQMIMGFDNFVDGKIRDTVKNIFCKNNNIKLIRIPYWEFDNIERILCEELNLKLRRKGNKQLK